MCKLMLILVSLFLMQCRFIDITKNISEEQCIRLNFKRSCKVQLKIKDGKIIQDELYDIDNKLIEIDSTIDQKVEKWVFADKFNLLDKYLSLDVRIRNMEISTIKDTTIYSLNKDYIEAKFPRKDFFYGDENELVNLKIYCYNNLVVFCDYVMVYQFGKKMEKIKASFNYSEDKLLKSITTVSNIGGENIGDTLLLVGECN